MKTLIFIGLVAAAYLAWAIYTDRRESDTNPNAEETPEDFE